MHGLPPSLPYTAAADPTRLSQWADAVTLGDPEGFRSRLSWSGWDEADAGAVLDALETKRAAVVQRWLATLPPLYAETTPGAGGDPEDATYAEVPFGDLFAPLVRARAAAADAALEGAYARQAPAVRAALERALLERFVHVTGRALYALFSVERAQLRRLHPWLALTGRHGAPLYRQFVTRHRQDAMRSFFERYPVAARLCETVGRHWQAMVIEFFERLAADRDRLASAFHGSAPLGPLTAVHLGLSDPHGGGRGVIIATFAAGVRVVYKPRPVRLDAFFRQFVAWFNEQLRCAGGRASTLLLKTPTVCARPGYGWVAFVEPATCPDAATVGRFYYRAGLLLSVVYGLNGTDFHYENLIANGEHPLLIDLEGLVAPRFTFASETDAADGREAARLAAEDTVLRTALLPNLKISRDGERVLDMGGLAGGLLQEAEQPQQWVWEAPNTDRMRLIQVRRPAELPPNAPILDGQRVDATAYVDEIVAGFEAGYAVLLAHREELLAAHGPLAALADAPVRFIFRPTSLYGALQERALHPKHLGCEADRFVQLDVLARAFLKRRERPSVWPILESERAQLDEMDIPCFMVPAGSTALALPQEGGRCDVLPDVFEASACDEVRRRLSTLSPRDRAQQTALIRAAFWARQSAGLLAPAASGSPETAPPTRSSKPDAAPPPHDPAALAVAYATSVAERLDAHAVRTPAGAFWFGLAYHPDSGRYQVELENESLADGSAGIALFLGALAHTSGDARWRGLACAAAQPIASAITERARFRASLPLGAGHGLGGAAYALTHLSRLLGAPCLLEDALRVARCVTPAMISADRHLHAFAGAAGLILGLRPLYDATGDADVLALMRAAASHLLACSTPGADTGAPHGPLTGAGLARGPVGLGLAFARLHTIDPDPRWQAAAASAFAAPVPLPRVTPASASWAEGAAGEVLARRAASDRHPEATHAIPHLRTALRTDAVPTDDVCGGRGGVWAAESVSTPGLHPALADLLLQATGAAAPMSRTSARPRFPWGDGYVHPGLFHGAPGLALLALHQTHPEAVPHVFHWAP